MAGASSSEKKRRKRKKKLLAAALVGDEDEEGGGGQFAQELSAFLKEDEPDDGALSDLTAHVQKLALGDDEGDAEAEIDQGPEPVQRVEDLRINTSQAATKRDHLMRNRVLVRPEVLAQLGVAPGASVMVGFPQTMDESVATRAVASAWPLGSLKPNEIQLSKSLRLLDRQAASCSLERLVAGGEVAVCATAHMRLQTADIRAQASVRQTLLDQAFVRDYVRENLVDECVALNTTCGLLLNGYFVNLVLEDATPQRATLLRITRTGKTLIARSAAQEFGASMHLINGAEVVSNYVGQAEARLHAIFEAALAQPPALVFIDEIDALCPARGQGAGAESGMAAVHTRVVGVLMQQLDRLAGAGRIAVVAASNRPAALDPALRRPGRLDREVEVGVPAASDRAEILGIHLSNYPHTLSSEEIASIADEMHGFVGADIMALCREAAWQALRRHLKSEAKGLGDREQQDDASGAHIALEDVLEARATIKPSALREFAVEVPKVYWDDVGGQEDVKMLLREAVEPEFHAAFARMGIRPPQGVLLYGPPGCSKTLLAKAIATECKMNFIAIKGPELFNKWVGESERAVHEVFRKARLAEPTVVFFDEIDALAGARGAGADAGSAGGVADRVLSQLLTEMDGIEARKRVIVVAATNRPDLVDAALLRPGRLDRLILVRPPDASAREAILRIHTRRMPLDADVDLGRLASATTQGFTGAEISSLCREAAMHALERDKDVQSVAYDDFAAAAKMIDPQVSEGMLEFYLDLERSLGQAVG
ncbi:26S proteasome regulatory subunit 7 [Hondaea fermentalgiana]|uniref:26S proteasome regulatory subunit 7 n=1 Tax=Hondaea fermentalgiana TaxID=2315210 RepID=A0A2R5GL13_9STRA|nr:26S proteasome regulatory subunit 7 [Hondaea fermentalgiana]|eukprot:GBG28564.1 26S proteasome regulatory subunit 7 [Hondaea fermentalgiana]